MSSSTIFTAFLLIAALAASTDFTALSAFNGAAPPAAVAVRYVGNPGAPVRIDGVEIWSASTRIHLSGPVEVAAGGTLIIEAGTRVEGVVGSYIVVARDGRIDARGTLNEPIELTCTAAAKYPGCWGGVIVHGYARINAGTPTSPISAERSAIGDCLELADPLASSQRFGGCNDADDSGFLRFVRIEYAERGLHLAGVGSGTEVQNIQANRTRSEGMLITGGAVDARHLFLTANGTGLRWTGGWRGRAQSIAVQQDVTRFAAGIVGQNGISASANPDALPRSQPQLFNITLIAQSVPSNPSHATARALVLERGTAGSIRNLFMYAPQIAIDVAGTAICSQLTNGALSLGNVLTAGAASLSEGTIPETCGATEAELLTEPANSNVVLPSPLGLFVSENDLYLPDLRPVADAALATAVAAPTPIDGFFVEGRYVGAVRRELAPGAIPWFSGWTNPAPPPAPIPTGAIRGTVRSPFRGILGGVRVNDESSGATTLTASNGTYLIELPAGTALLDVRMLPSGCPMPATRAGIVRPNDTTVVDLTVDCAPFPGVERISAGDGFTCGVADQGTYCWGENAYGQLGNGSTSASTIPVAVATSFSTVSTGAHHACGRQPSGVVRCWGDNARGQLGDGSNVNRTTPTAGPAGVFELVTAGGEHTCALADDGSAYCWGANGNGQLGNGSTNDALSPVLVAGGRTFATLSAGRNHTCGLDLLGAAWCWGANADGQLGDGSTSDRTQPVAVAGGQVYGALTASGDAHSCATGATGIVRCWGANESGQLGNGTTSPSSVPVVVQASTALSQLAAGDRHSCGITPDAISVCWGQNSEGQIGDGTTAFRTVPSAAAASARFNRMAGGLGFTCAVTFGAVTAEDNVIVVSRRSLLCWGRNTSGQFGRGSTESALTPTAAATGLTFP